VERNVETYQTEEEQIQAIKDWWKENGRSIVIGLIIGLAAIGGYRYWTNYVQTQSEQASVLYANVMDAAAEKNTEVALTAGKEVIEKYSSTPYAPLTALILGRLAVDNKDFASAEAQLIWVVEHASDEGIQYLARIRLSRVLAAQNKTDEALAMIANTNVSGFNVLLSELRGDIYLQQNNKSKAADEYRKALSDFSLNPQRRQLLQMKLDDLAETKEATS
jgi:predicted negative regulator of RcsB-dependent stress response